MKQNLSKLSKINTKEAQGRRGHFQKRFQIEEKERERERDRDRDRERERQRQRERGKLGDVIEEEIFCREEKPLSDRRKVMVTCTQRDQIGLFLNGLHEKFSCESCPK